MEWKKVLVSLLVVCLVCPPAYSNPPAPKGGGGGNNQFNLPLPATAPAMPTVPPSFEGKVADEMGKHVLEVMDAAPEVIAAAQAPIPAACPAQLEQRLTHTEARVARATAAAKAAIAESVDAIERINTQIEAANACGQKTKCAVLYLQKAANELLMVARPMYIGYKSETVDMAFDKLKSAIFQIEVAGTVKEARATFAGVLIAVSKGIFTTIAESFTALRSRNMLGDPTVFYNFIKQWTTVMAFQGMAVGLATYTQWSNPEYQIPWEIFFNTTAIMWLQSEVSANNTPRTVEDKAAAAAKNLQDALILPTPRNRQELYSQIPATIAGKQGFVTETAKRFLGFAALFPVEAILLLAAKTLTGAWNTGGASLLDGDVWSANAGAAAAFVSYFGLYLATKWSLLDKIVELRFLPSLQKMNSKEFRDQWNALAAEAGIPYKEKQEWRGWMVREFMGIFVPTLPPAEEGKPDPKLSWSGIFWHVLKGGVWGKFKQHLADRRKFAAFYHREDVAALRNSPAAKRAWWSQFYEQIFYRIPLTLADSYVAVYLMGTGDKKAAVQETPAAIPSSPPAAKP